MLLVGKSRIYRAGIDEEYYQSNTLFELMRHTFYKARELGNSALENIKRCNETVDVADQHYFAYSAGCDARRAFTAASHVLALDEERRSYLNNREVDWSKFI